MTAFIETLEALHALYGEPGDASLRKVARRLTPQYHDWIARSRFCILSTVGPEGTDATPRGDAKPVVLVLDEHTLAMPDWRGNNRIDSLRNIVRDPRVSLMFMIPGSNNVVRVNGAAKVTADRSILSRFKRKEILPRSVAVIRITEVYSQCARALIRSNLWTSGDESQGLPSMGQILAGVTDGDIQAKKFDETEARKYDDEWAERAERTMW